jgi:hypothetical protein
MIDICGVKRVGTSDSTAFASEFSLSEKVGFITGIELLMQRGAIAAINSGKMDIQIQCFHYFF